MWENTFPRYFKWEVKEVSDETKIETVLIVTDDTAIIRDGMLFLNPMPIKKLHSVILTILFPKVNGGGPDLWIPYVLSLQFPMGNDKRIGGLPSDITHRLAGLPRQAGKAIHGAWWTRFVLSETRQTHDMQQGTNSASIIHLTTSRTSSYGCDINAIGSVCLQGKKFLM